MTAEEFEREELRAHVEAVRVTVDRLVVDEHNPEGGFDG